MREFLVVDEQTTPATPAAERGHFIDGAATPPNLGGEWGKPESEEHPCEDTTRQVVHGVAVREHTSFPALVRRGGHAINKMAPFLSARGRGGLFKKIIPFSIFLLLLPFAALAQAPAVTVTTTSLPDGSFGSPYFATLNAINGTPPYTFAVSSGTLPPGVSLISGTISGTPTQTGTSASFTFQV